MSTYTVCCLCPTGRNVRFLFFFSVLLVCALPRLAAGSNATWNGSVDAQWSTVDNWDGPPAAVPGASDTATFNGAGNGNTVIDLGLGVTLKTLLFDTADAAAYILGTGATGEQALTLSSGGAVTVNAAVTNDQTVAATLALGGAVSFTVNPASTPLKLAGPVIGTGSLTKLGIGYLYLDSDNSFSGGVILGNGTTANTSVSGVASGGSCGYVVLGHNNALGTGTVTAKGVQIWAGVPGLVITNAFLTANSSFRFGGTNDLVIAGSFTLDTSRDFGNYSSTATLTMAGPFNLGSYNAAFKATGGAPANGTTYITGLISGTGGITLDTTYDNGNVVLARANTYSGNTTVNGGTLTLLHAGAAGTSAAAITLGASDARLELGDGVTLTRSVTVSNNENNKVLRVQTGASAEFAGPITVAETTSGNFDITADAGSTLTVSGEITSTAGAGATKLGEGTVVLAGTNTITGLFWVGNGISNLSDTDTATAGSGGFLVICNSNAFGLATLDFKGAQIRAGVPGLVIDNPLLIDQGSIRFSGTNDLELTGDAPLVNGATRGVGNYSGRSQLTFRGTLTTTNGWALLPQANNDAATNGTTRFLGPVIGDGRLEVDGNYDNGLVVLGGANSFSGTTIVNVGTLRLDFSEQDNSKLADAASLTLADATLELAGGTHLEQVGSTLVSGNARVTRSSGSAVLALGELTVNGALRLDAENIASTTSANTNGLLGGVTVTVGGITRWAVNSGVSDGGDGFLISAFGGSPSDVDRLGGVVPDDATLNVRIANGGESGSVTLAGTATNAVNTLTMDASEGPATLELSGGVLVIGGDTGGGIIQTSASGGLTVGTAPDDGILITGGEANGTPAALVLANDSTANALTVNTAIQNNGTDTISLSKQGVGTVILTGANSYSGGTRIDAGILQIGNGGNDGQLGAGGVIVNEGQLVASRGAGSGDLVVGPTILGSGSVIHNGASNARLILQGASSSFSGGITSNGGILRGQDTIGDTELLQLGTGPITLNGGKLELRGNGGASDRMIITGDGVTGNDILMSANATIDVAPYNSTDKYRNTFRFNNLTLGGSQLTFSGNYRYRCSFSGTSTLANDVIFNTTLDHTEGWLAFDGPLTDNGQGYGFTKLGVGTLVLNNDNTLSGQVLLGTETSNSVGPNSTTATSGSGGFVVLGHNNAFGTALVISRGTQFRAAVPGIVIPNDVIITNGGFRFGGTNDLAFSGTLTPIGTQRGIGNYSTDKTLTLQNIDVSFTTLAFEAIDGAAANGPIVVEGVISGGNTVNVRASYDNGRVIYAGANTCTGTTTIETGSTLQIGNGGTTGSLNPLSNIANNGTLAFNRSDTIMQGTDFDGLLSGTGRVSVEGSGTVVLTDANTYTGKTTINPGATLQFGNGGTAGSLSLSSQITDNGTFAVNRSDTVTQGTHFNAVVEGAGGILQAGTGTLILTGANTYTGATVVAAGTLLINGDQSAATGPATVAPDATLGGTGTCGGSVTVPADAILSPGESGAGAFGAASLTLQADAVYHWDLTSETNDVVQVGGDLTLPSRFTLDVHRLPASEFTDGKVLFTYGGAYTGPDKIELTVTGNIASRGYAVNDATNKRILLDAVPTGTMIQIQ